ncbi:MAG: hypothetical protein Q7W51_01245 [Coriobacteriia bacterium]|nr:hypothetical protein [Coriobacteriia bacterium]
MPELSVEMRAVEAVIRSLTTAAKTLRLYPPSSPIPTQAMQTATDALAGVLEAQPTLPLVVAREGFSFRGAPVNTAGAVDLANLLTSHGVAQVDFLPGCTTTELSAFMDVVLRDPAEVLAGGGAAAALAMAGAANIVVSEVVLTTVAAEMEAAGDIDAFLRELAGDEQKLATWLATAAAGDPGALSDGLAELARAVGPGGLESLQAALGKAYAAQDTASRDALVGLALGDSDGAPVLKGMMGSLRPDEVATSLADGLYARNMLSMSNVLTAIPFASLDQIIAELRPMLAGEGHTARELEFLDRMLDARTSSGREMPLADRQLDYQRVADFANIDAASLHAARTEIGASGSTVNTRTVNTMLSLLDQQQDFDLWSKTLQNLASIVPSLIEQGDTALASRVFTDLSGRESRTTQPWPGLAEQMREAFQRATSADAMSALLTAVLDDPEQVRHAESILRSIDQPAQARFVAAAIDQRQRGGLEMAERLLGRRLVGLLVNLAPEVPWFQAGAVALHLSKETDLHSRDALIALARRPDERSRQEVAKALAASSAALGVSILAELIKDPALEVSVTAVRSLGHSPGLGTATALERGFDALDWTGKDFALAREILGALARTPDSDAVRVLEKVTGQRTLIKRGHFAEIQDLARQALAARPKGGPRP